MSVRTPPAPPRITGFDYVRPLGRGGFADVFQYEQDMPRRIVAVKVLRSHLTEPRDRSDFEAEADAMARLSGHPSIVSVYSVGIAADGRPYLAMEFCPDSMRERTRNNPAPLFAVLDAGVRLAGALETAHRAGILHRDVKPSNVLITATGRPALTDFGIAILSGGGASEAREQALSIPWSAPEVVLASSTGTVASEVWSLGATLYTFAAGYSPFEHQDRSLNTQSKMSARIAAASYTPIEGSRGYERFDDVMRTAMHADPSQRYSSMREFGEALRQLQRSYGYDPTPLDVVEASAIPAAPEGDAPRGPVITSVRTTSRAQQRVELRARQTPTDRDGVLIDRPKSPLRAALIGAGAAVAGVAALLGLAFALGWVGWGG